MNSKYIEESFDDPLRAEAREQAIRDLSELNNEYLDRLPENAHAGSRLIFDSHACKNSPNYIKRALENNVVILLPL